MNLCQSSKVLILAIAIFSTCLFASDKQPNDTDELVKRNNPSWLTETIAPMSARDQLDSINTFKTEINAYRQQTNYILPLGPKSKEKLKNMSSWMYSNLVAETFNQSDLSAIIECAISLSECSFSNHYLFDALEYQLWTYNHELLSDLDYTRLFFAMAQSQYFPNQQTFGACASSYPGFDVHEHLGKIVINQKGMGIREDSAQVLANIIIGYNMMSGKAFSSIKGQFDSISVVFPLDGAIAALTDLCYRCGSFPQKKKLILSVPNRKNLYKSLLLDFICKTESKFSASACFDLAQVMPTEALKRQRKLILDMRTILNQGSKISGKPVSGFEKLIGKELAKLGSQYKVVNNVYDSNLCCEIDFVVTNTQTGTVTRIETDGHFHFNQNFHGTEITQDLNGITRLHTNLLRKFGKVLRVSGACDTTTYYKRISSVSKTMKDLEASTLRVGTIPSPGEHASEYVSFI